MRKKGPHQVINSRSMYKNPWIEVQEDNVIKPDGSEGLFGTVDYSPGVSIVAQNELRRKSRSV